MTGVPGGYADGDSLQVADRTRKLMEKFKRSAYEDYELARCPKCGKREFSLPPVIFESRIGIWPHVECLNCKTVQHLHYKGSRFSTNGYCGDPQKHFYQQLQVAP